MNDTAGPTGEAPPGHDGRPPEHNAAFDGNSPMIANDDSIAITDAGEQQVQDALSLAVADARHVISSMPTDEMRSLITAMNGDTCDQHMKICKAIVAAKRNDLGGSFFAIADAWEAAHAARIVLCENTD